MLHGLKKRVTKVTNATAATPSAQFQDYQLRLEAVKRNLQVADKRLDDCSKHWLKHLFDQRSFSAGFVEGVADHDSETYSVAHEFAEGAQTRYDHFVRETSPEDASYNKMHNQVKAYLEEIAEVEAMYPKLIEAKSEASRYQGKIDSIEKAKKVDDLKKTRNLEKLDAQRESFSQLQREVTEAQKKTFAKADTVMRMALVAYWDMNSTHVAIMNQSLEKTQDYATSNAPEMCDIDISTLEISSPGERLPSVPLTMPSSPRPLSSTSEAPLKENIPVIAS